MQKMVVSSTRLMHNQCCLLITVILLCRGRKKSKRFNKVTELQFAVPLLILQIGTHPEFLKRVKNIEETKTKKISAAQRNRDDQIKNIKELYDYEVKDIESTYLVHDTLSSYIILCRNHAKT